MSESLRVLHCVVRLDRGGYETLLMNLLRELAPKKVAFDFITSFPGTYDEEARSLGAHLHVLPFITQVGPFAYAKALRGILEEQPPRIVHSHMDKFSGLVMREAAHVGIPVRIAHAHNTHSEGNLIYSLVKHYYGQRVLPFATDLFACSAAAAQWMYGSKACQAHLLYNGINLSSFSADPAVRAQVREQWGLDDCFVLGHVGRFTPQKNHRHLLAVFRQLCHQRSDARLLVVGDGPLRFQIEALAEKEGLSGKVIFTGVRQDVSQFLAAMDVFVFPSLHEGLGMSLVEAQVAGLPCVCSNVVPSEAIVSGSVVRLGLKDPVQTWVDAILHPCAFSPPGARIEDYDIAHVANELQQFYQTKWQGLQEGTG